jgi:hypothetical protein
MSAAVKLHPEIKELIPDAAVNGIQTRCSM